MKPSKLYTNLHDNPRAVVSFRDFNALLEVFGFRLDRIRDSHPHYVHPAIHEVLTINPDGKDAHRYQVRTLLALIEEHSLTLSE
jgi:predicted RNA binding protein YcfA (HicA-like mRNA interferase family)